MGLRWIAAGMGAAGKQFRRVNGHLHLPALRATLERPFLLSPRQGGCRLISSGPPPKFHGERDNLPGEPTIGDHVVQARAPQPQPGAGVRAGGRGVFGAADALLFVKRPGSACLRVAGLRR
jgi:hypothetical protein